jgi:hypothetical protein
VITKFPETLIDGCPRWNGLPPELRHTAVVAMRGSFGMVCWLILRDSPEALEAAEQWMGGSARLLQANGLDARETKIVVVTIMVNHLMQTRYTEAQAEKVTAFIERN